MAMTVCYAAKGDLRSTCCANHFHGPRPIFLPTICETATSPGDSKGTSISVSKIRGYKLPYHLTLNIEPSFHALEL
ncbi:hypothetical protein KIN20_004334 [Parelaphostrongylus tenuis]|uniref:Uncharacterized protein n=1 Tax=Parelaphostrongylus tenuis TaxID=148309 RepID=A0AAD5QHY9_PARTN|nr:hypothetical protein KIN20_004334 [Parelaphostrongylus tenuis]